MMLSLEMFGYYMLSVTIGTFITVFAVPIVLTIFPRFTELITKDKIKELVSLYHRSCQLLSIFVLPAALFVSIFSYEILYLWLQNKNVAIITAPIVSIYLIGATIDKFRFIPYNLQLAYNWTRLGFFVNIISILFYIPALIFAAQHFGAIGAAWVWAILNCGYILIEIPIMHNRILKNEMASWYKIDVGIPLLVVTFTTLLAHYCIPQSLGQISKIFYYICTFFFTTLCTTLSVPFGRMILKEKASLIFPYGIQR